MSAAQDDHGSTPAAWTATSIMLAGLTVSAFAVWLNKPVYFWVGMVVIAAGGATGWIMAKAGLGQPRPQ